MKLRQLLILGLAAVALASCKSRKYTRNNKQVEREAVKANPNYTNFTTLSYIDRFKDVSIEEMNKYGIPASITLAQGILESGSGNSDLAKYANNHFGIKCTSNWKGKAYYKDDDQKDDCFRVYLDAQESYRDHSDFLKRKRYAALFELDKNDYKNWAYGLKSAGYATNPKYPDLLINIIEKYNLQQYDQAESETEKLKREDRVLQQINTGIPKEKQKYTPVAVAPKDPPSDANTNMPLVAVKPQDTSNNGLYTIKSGDTLFGIAKLFGLSVAELKELNQLDNDAIQPNQKLKVRQVATSTNVISPQIKPAPSNNAYLVKKGDTLFSIAKSFNLTVDELKELNSLSSNSIQAGQKLLVTKH